MAQLLDRVLITGGRGMLAQAIARTLARSGHSPLSLDSSACDITSPASIDAAFDNHQPTLVINCAAFTNVDGCETQRERANAVNGTGVGNLARAAAAADVPIVHYSTDYVFAGDDPAPLAEETPVHPQSAYGHSKLLGEQLLQEASPRRFLLLRTAWLYGPGGPSFPATMLRVAREGKPLRIVADQIGCPTYTLDLAEATLDLLATDANGIFHAVSRGQVSWFDFANAIFTQFSVEPASLTPITSADWKAMKPDSAVRPAFSVLSTSKLDRAIGREMPGWQTGLARFHREQAAT